MSLCNISVCEICHLVDSCDDAHHTSSDQRRVERQKKRNRHKKRVFSFNLHCSHLHKNNSLMRWGTYPGDEIEPSTIITCNLGFDIFGRVRERSSTLCVMTNKACRCNYVLTLFFCQFNWGVSSTEFLKKTPPQFTPIDSKNAKVCANRAGVWYVCCWTLCFLLFQTPAPFMK